MTDQQMKYTTSLRYSLAAPRLFHALQPDAARTATHVGSSFLWMPSRQHLLSGDGGDAAASTNPATTTI